MTIVVEAGVRGSYAGSNDLASVVATFTSLSKKTQNFDVGTTINKVDKVFSDRRTLAASATENLDLAGSLTDPVGATLTFAKVKAVLVIASVDNTNNVVVGGAGSNTFLGMFSDATDKVVVKPGGVFLWMAPDVGATVTAGTGDILLVANSSSGTPVTYDIVILGTSA